mgnify:CR=1 FL=1
MKSVVHVLLLLAWVHGAFCQEPPVSAFMAEMEDSVSSLSIKPIKRPEKLLKQIVERLKLDLQQEHETCSYQIEASFSQGALMSFSASGIVSAEAGVGLDNVRIEEFRHEGPYDLALEDTINIKSFLLQFATLSPLHAHKAYWEERRAFSPLRNAKETMRCYDVTADSIADETGRSVLRFRFVWKEKQGKDFDWERYNGEITGTAYFNSRTLRIIGFKGKAYLPSLKYITRLHYQIDYHKRGRTPVVRQVEVQGTKDAMKMRATIRKVVKQELL